MQTIKTSASLASRDRATRHEILLQAERFPSIPLLDNFITSIFDMVFVLNGHGQIVVANDNTSKLLGLNNPGNFVGLRTGEAWKCVHAAEAEGGCGAAPACQPCAILKAIKASQKGSVAMQECRITRENRLDPLEVRVYATPLQLNGDHFTIFAVSDVSHEKLRRALERIFFHDILNTVGGLHGFVELLQQSDPSSLQEFKSPLLQLSRELVEEIKSQRDLVAAENNDLFVNPVLINSRSVLDEVVELYKNHEVANRRQMKIDQCSVECDLITDPPLLRRVVSNMVKNGLEASSDDETVTLGCHMKSRGVEFWVHNSRFIPKDVQALIFRRSFSTKGSNRGIGTYSMKLIGERYLGGKVRFTSYRTRGTAFSIWLPLSGAGS